MDMMDEALILHHGGGDLVRIENVSDVDFYFFFSFFFPGLIDFLVKLLPED